MKSDRWFPKLQSILNWEIPRRYSVYTGIAAASFIVGWSTAWWYRSKSSLETIAMQRRMITPIHYTNAVPAVVSVQLTKCVSNYSVHLELQAETRHGTGSTRRDLGYVNSRSEALELWGTVDWRPDGIHVGKGSNEYVMPKREVEDWSR